MKRRNFFKSIGAIGAVAALPKLSKIETPKAKSPWSSGKEKVVDDIMEFWRKCRIKAIPQDSINIKDIVIHYTDTAPALFKTMEAYHIDMFYKGRKIS